MTKVYVLIIGGGSPRLELGGVFDEEGAAMSAALATAQGLFEESTPFQFRPEKVEDLADWNTYWKHHKPEMSVDVYSIEPDYILPDPEEGYLEQLAWAYICAPPETPYEENQLHDILTLACTRSGTTVWDVLARMASRVFAIHSAPRTRPEDFMRRFPWVMERKGWSEGVALGLLLSFMCDHTDSETRSRLLSFLEKCESTRDQTPEEPQG